MPSYFGRRQTHAAGQSWRKWGSPLMVFEDPEDVLDPRYPVRLTPWIEFRAGAVGFWLVCASAGALAALLARGY